MDIVKHGKYHINEFRMKCRVCDCIFDYAKNDIHDYAGTGPKVYVTCPECGRWNNRTKQDIKKVGV